MKSFVIFLFLLLTAPALQLKAQKQQVVPFTLADRDRITRTEMRLEALESKMNTRFEALESKMDTKFAALESKIDTKFEAVNQRIYYIFWLLSFNAALIIFILGFIIRDRRTALRPDPDKAGLCKGREFKSSRHYAYTGSKIP